MWKLKFKKKASKELKKLGRSVAEQVMSFLEAKLKSDNPLHFAKPLSGDKWGFYSFRMGGLRILTQVIENELIILVVSVGNRDKVYKNLVI